VPRSGVYDADVKVSISWANILDDSSLVSYIGPIATTSTADNALPAPSGANQLAITHSGYGIAGEKLGQVSANSGDYIRGVYSSPDYSGTDTGRFYYGRSLLVRPVKIN
jgi:hypothetical protein